MIKMASITVQVILVLALFTVTTYSQAETTDASPDNKQCQNSFPNGGLNLLAKVYERVNKLEMEIKKTRERLDACGCGGGADIYCSAPPSFENTVEGDVKVPMGQTLLFNCKVEYETADYKRSFNATCNDNDKLELAITFNGAESSACVNAAGRK